MGIVMKKMTYAVSLATFATTAAVALATGTASAATPGADAPVLDPHTMSVPIAPGVQYTSNTTDRSTVLSTPIGTLTTLGGQIQLNDAKGATVYGQKTFTALPKAASTLPAAPNAPTTHQVDAAVPSPKPVDASAHDPQADFNSALGTAATQFGLATGVGGMVGGVGGAIIGCPLGVVTGGVLTSATIIGTPLGIIGGCILGASAVGGVGAILGGATLGIPVGIASGVQMYNTLHAQGDV
ncbi:hypothetical protein [Nocardia jiangxiensis]|uniref:GLTT repeat-containing protein n=1 Tax=Nocardia jiangxiensis TaxID=282685 RepID=A0ABW6RZX1_9NOCA|nr:hypothetical protein [Nocardia jiangxiensis]